MPLNNQEITYEYPRFITICRLSDQRKNIDLVIKALSNIKSFVDFEYTIIGDGFLRPNLEKLVADLGLSENIKFTGKVTKSEIREYLHNSDLFILTSSSSKKNVEGFGIVYLEANACGVPVLAAKEGGSAEAIQPGINGFFVNDISVNSLTKVLSDFIKGKYQFNRDSCRNFANQYNWSNITDKIISIYNT
ncbi:glycosyltransferase [Picosynechococcus sp. NKBG042902]|nr:glycosyltransferase [Picosynechococcus sp. NKBG042902]